MARHSSASTGPDAAGPATPDTDATNTDATNTDATNTDATNTDATGTAATATATAHSWAMPRGAIVLLTLAGLVVAVAGIKSVASMVGPLFLALMLTVAVQPIPNWLRRKGWPRWSAFIVTLLLVYGILIGMFGALAYSIARLATILPTYSDKFDDLVDSFKGFLTDHGVDEDKVHEMLSHLDASKLISLVTDLLSSTLSVASALILVVTVLLFMAADAMGFDERMAVVRDARPDIASAFSTFARGTRSYLWVSTVFGLIVAVFDTGALWLIGVPLPVLWGLLSFITNYIPNIGFVLGVIPPALLGLLDGGASEMLLVIAVYSVINVIIQSVIQPKFVGDAVGLSTTLTFVSLIFWTWVIGPLGAILAVPLTLFAKALLIDIDPSTRWADVLVSSWRPGQGPPPPAQDAYLPADEPEQPADEPAAQAGAATPAGDTPDGTAADT